MSTYATSRPDLTRGIFCNRTLNLRSIRAIGYDMDYTLIHYHVRAWEERAFEALRNKLLQHGWPVDSLAFDPDFVVRGLIIDKQLGNLVKANRFGYIKRAFHGTQPLDYDTQRETYARTIVDLAEPRWAFLNTLFSISEASAYAQLVDLLDARKLPGVMNYDDLYQRTRRSLDEAHMEGQLKAQIIAEPERFVDLDENIPLTLLDQREAGKRLLLITNSGWPYTLSMMRYAFNPFLPKGMTWRDLFEIVIVSARKPAFFGDAMPLFEVLDDSGCLKPAYSGISEPGAYFGGHAGFVEDYLGLAGSQILYVGDHIYGDVHMSKSVRRWRTALIIRELEDELAHLKAFRPQQRRLSRLMSDKVELEFQLAQHRLALQRLRKGYAPGATASVEAVEAAIDETQRNISELDQTISPLARASSRLFNARWGLLMRAGNDKSHFARQIERHADVYTSRVSNFMYEAPFSYLRSTRGSLPHDGDVWLPLRPNDDDLPFNEG